MNNKNKKYDILYADCPWSFKNKNTGGNMNSGALNHYSTMTVDELCRLPVDEIISDNCVLFMWWVASQPKEALMIVDSWGFELKTMTAFTWAKTTKTGKQHFGMGHWTRMGSENCLLAIKGKPKRINAGVRSVYIEEFEEETYFHPVTQHSEKPAIFRDRIVELMGDKPRLEMFARKETDGWDVFGNEVNNSIKL